MVLPVFVVCKELRTVPGQFIKGASSHRECAERVGETRMLRGGECEIREAELTQAAQALHRGEVEQTRLGRIEFDEVMNRIEYSLQC